MMVLLDRSMFLRAIILSLATLGLLNITQAEQLQGDVNKTIHQTPVQQAKSKRTIKIGGKEFQITGPYTHQNLSVFVISSDEQNDAQFITLDQGLKQKLVVISEKPNAQVSELIINNMARYPLYLQEGDRVSGGQQDRTIRSPLVIKPRSGRMALPTFCIEQSRWSTGQSGSNLFAASVSNAVAPRSVRHAAKIKGSQGEVWSKVASKKKTYAKNLKLANSNSSLNESLDSTKAMRAINGYVVALENVIKNADGAVGVVFAVNGDVEEANIYLGKRLTSDIYPRLLKSFALDAAASLYQTKRTPVRRSPSALNEKDVKLRNRATQYRLNIQQAKTIAPAGKAIEQALSDIATKSGVKMEIDWGELARLNIKQNKRVRDFKKYDNAGDALTAALKSVSGRRTPGRITHALINGKVHVSSAAGIAKAKTNLARMIATENAVTITIEPGKITSPPTMAAVVKFIDGKRGKQTTRKINTDNTLKITVMDGRHYCESYYGDLLINRQWIRGDDVDTKTSLNSQPTRQRLGRASFGQNGIGQVGFVRIGFGQTVGGFYFGLSSMALR